MTRNEFWILIDRLISETSGDLGRFEEALDAHLRSLESTEIQKFSDHFAELQNAANTPAVLEAAFIIGCGASNDGFMDFRRWIVFQGKAAYERIVANPDFLGHYSPDSDPMENWYSEYDPSLAYEEVTGEDPPYFEVDVYPDERSDCEKNDILADRYPELWRRCKS